MPHENHDPEHLDPAVMREQYRSSPLHETDLAAPRWTSSPGGSSRPRRRRTLFEPNAMVVSTATPDGRPSSRTVLLKQFDERGFVFFTNYASRKGRELAANPYVSLLFPWHPIARQVVVTGTAARIGRDETAAYFRSRPHGSQLGAWASEQSSVIGSRANCWTAATRNSPPATRRASRSRCRRSGAASGSPRRRWSSGRATRTACTTGCGTSARADDWRVERLCP